MEKYENIIKIEEIRRLAENKEYILAAQIVDTMDISKVKATTDLSTIVEVLIRRERYDEAIEVLNKIYEKSISRRVVFQLLDVSIKRDDILLAKRYYDEYLALAPRDPSKYIFQYLIKRLEDKPIKEQIIPLKELKKYEYIEEWAYELASLYHKAGMKEECIEECNDIIIWFGSGEYVKRAELLKGYHEGKVDLFSLLEDIKEEAIASKEEKTSLSDIYDQVETEQLEIEQAETEQVGTEINKEELSKAEDDLLGDYLDDENINYKEIFGDILDNKLIRNQIIELLKEIKNDDITYHNFTVTSNDLGDIEDKTSFAKGILTVLFKLGYISCNKVGVLDAKTFNKIDSEKKKSALKNCSLIIEDAHLLTNNAIDEIEELILNKEQNILFVLQGSKEEIKQLFKKHLHLYFYFQIEINL